MSQRILIFSLGYYPEMVGGAEIALKEITDRIAPADAEFDMVTLRYNSLLPHFEKIGNVNVYRIGFTKKSPSAEELLQFPMYLTKVWYPIGAFFKALSLERKNNYTAVWSMMSYMGFPAVFLKFFYPRLKFILTLQEGDTVEHITARRRIRLVSFLYRQIFKKASIVQVISNYLGDFARNMGYQGKIEVIPNGVDLQHFSQNYPQAELEQFTQKLGKKTGDVFLVTSSRLVEKNAVEDIINALPLLPENVKLLIAGNGPLEKTLKQKVADLKLTDRVIFLGYIAHAELPKYLKVSDIFIRPSLSEGMGNSFIEAMAAEIPVIGTAVGGITDFLKDGETGLVVEVKNPQNIAQKVEKLLKDGESRAYMVRNAKEVVVKSYGFDLIARDMRQKVFNV